MLWWRSDFVELAAERQSAVVDVDVADVDEELPKVVHNNFAISVTGKRGAMVR